MNIFNSPKEIFEKIERDYSRYLKNRGNILERDDLFDIVVGLYHLCEWIEKDDFLLNIDKEFCNRLRKNENFILINRMANLNKHRKPQKNSPRVEWSNGFCASINGAGQALDIQNLLINSQSIDIIIDQLLKTYKIFFQNNSMRHLKIDKNS